MAMVLLLGGCGEKSAAEPFDPAETAQALLDSGAFTDQLAQISNQVAVTLYGLDADTLSDDSVVYVSSGASAEELAVLQFTDDSAAESAVSLLKQRVEKQTAACQDYLPDEILKLSSAITEVRGNTAVLVVAADASAAQKVLDGES
ncbi:MAG: hypothetical protein H6Q60_40 [Oscillospiraceae bacterium]|nr:hypothetical protein [Oscillospiraceae bacterium]